MHKNNITINHHKINTIDRQRFEMKNVQPVIIYCKRVSKSKDKATNQQKREKNDKESYKWRWQASIAEEQTNISLIKQRFFSEIVYF